MTTGNDDACATRVLWLAFRLLIYLPPRVGLCVCVRVCVLWFALFVLRLLVSNKGGPTKASTARLAAFVASVKRR